METAIKGHPVTNQYITDEQFIQILRFMNRTRITYQQMADDLGMKKSALYSMVNTQNRSIPTETRTAILEYCGVEA